MREITDPEELAELTGSDVLCAWAVQGFTAGHTVWTVDDGSAVAIAAPRLGTRDRIAVWGSVAGASALLPLVLEELGPDFRTIGDRELIRMLVDRIASAGGHRLQVTGEFGWMERSRPLADEVSDAHWLGVQDRADIDRLLDLANPGSYVRPGDAGVERWAGIHDADHRLIAVGALAWPAPTVGFIAGVAVHPDSRGHGLAERVCRLIAGETLRQRGAVALWVDEDNVAAIRTYQKLGLRYHPIAAAEINS